MPRLNDINAAFTAAIQQIRKDFSAYVLMTSFANWRRFTGISAVPRPTSG